MKRLNEQIDRIKSVMGLINEQEEYQNFISQGFFNCRGIRLKMPSDPAQFGGFAGYGEKSEYKDNWDEISKTGGNKKEFEKFLKENPDFKDKITLSYWAVLNRDVVRIKNFNNGGRYEYLFNSNGDDFTDSFDQKKADNIDTLLKGGESWFFIIVSFSEENHQVLVNYIIIGKVLEVNRNTKKWLINITRQVRRELKC